MTLQTVPTGRRSRDPRDNAARYCSAERAPTYLALALGWVLATTVAIETIKPVSVAWARSLP
jgi:hypothetical protein